MATQRAILPRAAPRSVRVMTGERVVQRRRHQQVSPRISWASVSSATVRNTKKDSLRNVLTDWNPASTGTGGYADIRARLLVTDDGSSGDRLTGGAGTDWFWAFLPPDSIADQEAGEQRN